MANKDKYRELLKDPKVSKYLEAIRLAESSGQYDVGYDGTRAGTKVPMGKEHPGYRINKKDPKGKKPSAAGGYMFLKDTWNGLKKNNKTDLDFSNPEDQDIAALMLADELGQLGNIQSGDYRAASDKLQKVWNSIKLKTPEKFAAEIDKEATQQWAELRPNGAQQLAGMQTLPYYPQGQQVQPQNNPDFEHRMGLYEMGLIPQPRTQAEQDQWFGQIGPDRQGDLARVPTAGVDRRLIRGSQQNLETSPLKIFGLNLANLAGFKTEEPRPKIAPYYDTRYNTGEEPRFFSWQNFKNTFQEATGLGGPGDPRDIPPERRVGLPQINAWTPGWNGPESEMYNYAPPTPSQAVTQGIQNEKRQAEAAFSGQPVREPMPESLPGIVDGIIETELRGQ